MSVLALTENANIGIDSWSFPPTAGSTIARTVQFTPRFVVNSIRAAVESAVQGRGVVRMFSYHLSDSVAEGTLRIILADDDTRRCRHIWSRRTGAFPFRRSGRSSISRCPGCAKLSANTP